MFEVYSVNYFSEEHMRRHITKYMIKKLNKKQITESSFINIHTNIRKNVNN